MNNEGSKTTHGLLNATVSECPRSFGFAERCDNACIAGDGRSGGCFGLLFTENPPKPIPRGFPFDPLWYIVCKYAFHTQIYCQIDVMFTKNIYLNAKKNPIYLFVLEAILNFARRKTDNQLLKKNPKMADESEGKKFRGNVKYIS